MKQWFDKMWNILVRDMCVYCQRLCNCSKISHLTHFQYSFYLFCLSKCFSLCHVQNKIPTSTFTQGT